MIKFLFTVMMEVLNMLLILTKPKSISDKIYKAWSACCELFV